MLVVISVVAFDRLKIDDPVGALSVHLVNGVFGTLAVGLFAQDGLTGVATGNGLLFGGGTRLLGAQLLDILAVGAFTFAAALLVWAAIKATLGIRVSLREEIEGLDRGEHGNEAYPDFLTRKPAYSFNVLSGAAVPQQASQALNKGGGPAMKLLTAVIRPEKLAEVKQALTELGCNGLMITEIEGHGTQKGIIQQWRGERYKVDLLPKVKLELLVKDSEVEKIKRVILESARTGEVGDGKIFIFDNVAQVIRIRTGEEGEKAL